MGHFIDLTGQKFGRLTVVRYLQMNERSNKKIFGYVNVNVEIKLMCPVII